MSSRDPDVLVVGSGPNGLVAACTLARHGCRVLVLEANPHRPGGALASEEATLPGFVHDVGAAFFPLARVSPAFRELSLESRGVEWLYGAFESCHVARDGAHAAIARDAELTRQTFGSERDGARWVKQHAWLEGISERLFRALLGPVPSIGAWLALGPANLARLARAFAASSGGLGRRWFESRAARRVLPGLALHADLGPQDGFGAPTALVLALAAGTVGFPVPRGGARSVSNALINLLDELGGRVRLGSRVARVLVHRGRARGVVLADGTEIEARHAVLADTSARSLYLDLLDPGLVPRRVLRKMRRTRPPWGTFKLDLALSQPVPWQSDVARRSAVVHVGESCEALQEFTLEVRSGKLPSHPYLVVGQQSLLDGTRAPGEAHTLYVYTHVPSALESGWGDAAERFSDRVVARIEELAPGFTGTILAKRAVTPETFERQNANLEGGDLGGGSSRLGNQLLFRPVFPYFRHRAPVRGLYLCSSYTHPGGGVHGMCGYNAAHVALEDID